MPRAARGARGVDYLPEMARDLISGSSGDGRELGFKAKLGKLDDKPLRPHYFGQRLQGKYAACPPSVARNWCVYFQR
jgi:hypothetical protein